MTHQLGCGLIGASTSRANGWRSVLEYAAIHELLENVLRPHLAALEQQLDAIDFRMAAVRPAHGYASAQRAQIGQPPGSKALDRQARGVAARDADAPQRLAPLRLLAHQ